MSSPAETSDAAADPGSCWECGYALRGLAADIGNCPDCGREFNANDPASVNGAGHARFARFLRRALKPVGWPTVGLCATAAGLVLLGTGGVTGFYPDFLDWEMLERSFNQSPTWDGLSLRWLVYTLGVALVGVVVVWLMVRVVVRQLVVLCYRPPDDLRRGRWGVAAALALLLGLSLAWVACGGALRIGREWAEGILKAPPPAPGAGPALIRGPVHVTGPALRRVVRALAIEGDSPRHRRAAMSIIQFDLGADVQGTSVFQDAAARERDAELLATELRFLALYRKPETIDFLARFLDDPRPGVRAGAADAIGMVCSPAYPLERDPIWSPSSTAWLNGVPPIPLTMSLLRVPAVDFTGRGHPMPPERRSRLVRMMTEGASLDEREGAARALLPQPPREYQFRYAEWGVWLQEKGNLNTVRAVDDEIPPFVHRTGNSISEFVKRLATPYTILAKPVIHLTVEQPTPVDLEVRIRKGRPWYAYPMPDDFEVTATSLYAPPVSLPQKPPPGMQPATAPAVQHVPMLFKQEPPDGFAVLSPRDMRSGYPWLEPGHRKVPAATSDHDLQWGYDDVSDVGLHWQSLIVTPAKRSWTAEPATGVDPRFRWWQRLRKVECSWVSSRGESERFLYYDGPTQMQFPLTLRLEGETVRCAVPRLPRWGFEAIGDPRDFTDSARSYRDRRLRPPEAWWMLAVRVSRDVAVEFSEMAPGFDDRPFDPADHRVAHGGPEDAVEALREALLAYGLTASESAGLLDVWRQPFFGKVGTRVLTIMPASAYEMLCPLVIRPIPTERVRVGIVMTELTSPPATQPVAPDDDQ